MPTLVKLKLTRFEIGQVVLEKIFKFRQYLFSLFRNYLPFEKVWPFIWRNFNPYQSSMICAKGLTQWFWRIRLFKLRQCYFIIFPLGKERGPLFEQTCIPFCGSLWNASHGENESHVSPTRNSVIYWCKKGLYRPFCHRMYWNERKPVIFP